MTNHVKERLEDKELIGEVTKESFERKELVRLYAVKVIFTDVSFKQASIAHCYFRNCTFIRCDFTGAHVKDTNLRGSSFSNCKFSYTTWDKSVLDETFLDSCLPSEENLARDLVRALRVNFAQVGNYHAVNRAAALEVKLTGQHLYNAAYSKQGYYRSKYSGFSRIKHAFKHAGWKCLDLLWGNGESLGRILISSVIVIIIAAIWLALANPKIAFSDAMIGAFLQFWGITVQSMSYGWAVSLIIARFVLFGLFMAILVKRLSRR
jgi:uncharacterized protein YjbI with pentapeptide repeats